MTVRIPRAEDLPYWSSPPIQWVYESTAALSLGSYTWADTASAMTPARPVMISALYFIRSVSLIADVSELDFQANITTTPQFYTFLRSDSNAPLFREPLQMNKYYDGFTYRFYMLTTHQDPEVLSGAFVGALQQGPALIGKSSITLKAVISAQEVVDDNYIKQFKANYPLGGEV